MAGISSSFALPVAGWLFGLKILGLTLGWIRSLRQKMSAASRETAQNFLRLVAKTGFPSKAFWAASVLNVTVSFGAGAFAFVTGLSALSGLLLVWLLVTVLSLSRCQTTARFYWRRWTRLSIASVSPVPMRFWSAQVCDPVGSPVAGACTALALDNGFSSGRTVFCRVGSKSSRCISRGRLVRWIAVEKCLRKQE